ncbi:MAG TPA: coproporphyrinogen III oxidase, partial [Chitinophagaceae bacterium]
TSYWLGKHYLGLGPSAHSFNGESRQWNVPNNAVYIRTLNQNELPFEKEILSDAQRLNEYIMTSLRTIEGLDIHYVRERFGLPAAENISASASKHAEAGYIYQNGHQLQLTRSGKLMADGIAADLFSV